MLLSVKINLKKVVDLVGQLSLYHAETYAIDAEKFNIFAINDADAPIIKHLLNSALFYLLSIFRDSIADFSQSEAFASISFLVKNPVRISSQLLANRIAALSELFLTSVIDKEWLALRGLDADLAVSGLSSAIAERISLLEEELRFFLLNPSSIALPRRFSPL